MRLSFWISGGTACHRFLHAVSPLLNLNQPPCRIEIVRQLLEQLYVLIKRARNETWRNPHTELCTALDRLPSEHRLTSSSCRRAED